MTCKTIENPTVDDVQVGDVVTITKGEKGQPGYQEQTLLVNNDDTHREAYHLNTIRGLHAVGGYRITEVRREVPDLPDLPDYAGALAFTNSGLAVNDGDDDSLSPWNILDGDPGLPYLMARHLESPVAATPVPSKELAELVAFGDLVAALVAESYDSATAALYDFLEACRREWERAGVPEPEVKP